MAQDNQSAEYRRMNDTKYIPYGLNKNTTYLEYLQWVLKFYNTRCPRCNAFGATEWPSMTMYQWDGKGEDPNRDIVLCDLCGEEYDEMMKERWDEYYGGRI